MPTDEYVARRRKFERERLIDQTVRNVQARLWPMLAGCSWGLWGYWLKGGTLPVQAIRAEFRRLSEVA